MSSVWYVGPADTCVMSSADWQRLGISAPTATWDRYNGWSQSQSSFTAPQLAILSAHVEFVLTGTDGARPGGLVVADPYAAVTRSETLTLVEAGKQSRAARAGSNIGLAAPRVAVIGDSIENLYSFNTATQNSFGKDWPTFAMLASNGGFQLVRNAGVGGETTAQYLARFDADINSYNPNTVIIGGAENDIQGSVPLQTIRANIEAMVAKAIALRATPVLRTTLPHFLSNAIRQKIGAYNYWVRNYCAFHGLPCLDFWAKMVNPATGQYQASYSSDGIHPNELASQILGVYAAQILAPPNESLLSLAMDPTDAGMLLPNPLFTTNSAGTPTTWNAIGGTPSGVTRSMVTDAQVPGQMARIANVASAAGCSISSNSSFIGPTQVAPGDILELSGQISSDGGVAASVTGVMSYNDGSAKTIIRVPVAAIARPLVRAGYRVRFPAVPTGTFTNFIVTLGSASGTGIIDFSYPVVRNLTREGIL